MRIGNKKLFIDLKYFFPKCHILALKGEVMADEFWKNNICSDHGLLAHIRIPAMRKTIEIKGDGSIYYENPAFPSLDVLISRSTKVRRYLRVPLYFPSVPMPEIGQLKDNRRG